MEPNDEARQQIDARQELKIVAEMIQKTQQTVADRGAFFLLWGVLVSLACLITFALNEYGRESLIWLPWATFMPIGGIVSMVLKRRYSKRARHSSYVEHAYDSVWLACGLAFFIMIFANTITMSFPPESVYPFISLIAGIGLFASGRIMEWTSLWVGALFLWGGGVTMMLVPFHYHPLIMSVALVPGYLIPGYLLMQHFRGQNADPEG